MEQSRNQGPPTPVPGGAHKPRPPKEHAPAVIHAWTPTSEGLRARWALRHLSHTKSMPPEGGVVKKK